jgi:hypothetical protein
MIATLAWWGRLWSAVAVAAALVGPVALDGVAGAQPARDVGRAAPGWAKLDPRLARLVERLREPGARPDGDSSGAWAAGPDVRVDPQGRVQVEVDLRAVDEAALHALEAAGLVVELSDRRHRLVQGWIPIDRLDEVAQVPSVRRVRPPDYAVPRGRARPG